MEYGICKPFKIQIVVLLQVNVNKLKRNVKKIKFRLFQDRFLLLNLKLQKNFDTGTLPISQNFNTILDSMGN